jgi:pimeloyl-ACP methyl ester carboxylesterase
MAGPATVVLVHGAFHGPWCWEKVTSLLQARDVPTALVDRGVGEPRQVSSDPWLDQERVREVVNEVARPVVLVGHSQGGVGVTYGGADNHFVRHLVYLTAVMPGVDLGETQVGTELVVSGMRPTETGTIFDPGLAEEVFFNDCDPEDVAWALARLDPQAPAPRGAEPPAALAWREKPSTYVVCTDDHTHNLEAQRVFAAHATYVAEWPTSHSPFVSRPGLVADLLADLAEQYAE